MSAAVLAELSHEDRLQLARDLRDAEAAAAEAHRLATARESDRFRTGVLLSNERRRIGKLTAERDALAAELAPAEEAVEAPEPVRAEYATVSEFEQARSRWWQLRCWGQDLLRRRSGTLQFLQREVAEGEATIAGLQKKLE